MASGRAKTLCEYFLFRKKNLKAKGLGLHLTQGQKIQSTTSLQRLKK